MSVSAAEAHAQWTAGVTGFMFKLFPVDLQNLHRENLIIVMSFFTMKYALII